MNTSNSIQRSTGKTKSYLPDTKPWRFKGSKVATRCDGILKNGERKGERCQQLALKGRRGCPCHGGKTPAGADQPAYTTGRYSKYLPEKLAGRYEKMLDNSRLLSLIDEIALIDAKVIETFETAPTTVDVWRNIRIVVDNMPDDACKAQLLDLVDSGYCEARNWDKTVQLFEQRRKLVETERRLIDTEQHSLTIDKAMMLINAVADVVKRVVKDPAEQMAIGMELRLLKDKGEL